MASRRGTLTIEQGECRELIHRVATASIAEGHPRAIAVVGESGELIAFYRMDGVAGTVGRLAMSLAFTALKLQMPSEAVRRVSIDYPDVWSGLQGSLPRASPLTGAALVSSPGGLPIERNGRIVGAIGVAGALPGCGGDPARNSAVAAEAIAGSEAGQDLADLFSDSTSSNRVTVGTAARLVEAAIDQSRKMDTATSIAVVGADGDLVALEAMAPGRSHVPTDCAKSKAYVAWRFGISGPAYEAMGERASLWTALSDMAPEVFLPSEGAVTLLDNQGKKTGGLGIAGTRDEDYVVAEAAAAAVGLGFVPRGQPVHSEG